MRDGSDSHYREYLRWRAQDTVRALREHRRAHGPHYTLATLRD